MIVDVILGVNIDTSMWISDLQKLKADHIVVIDYSFHGEEKNIEGIKYISPNYALNYLKKFDTINYYKSLYAYPGMGGKMASLHKKSKKNKGD